MKFVKYLPALLVLLGLTISARLVGALFRIQHWQRNDEFLFYSFIPLVLFLVAVILISPYSNAFPILNRPFKTMPGGLKKFFRVAIAVTVIGALFKIQHWKGADIELILGLSALAMLILAWTVVLALKVYQMDNKPKQ